MAQLMSPLTYDDMYRHASPEAIQAHLDDARVEQRRWQRQVERLEALARLRAEQISRGEWPPKEGA